jgi:hypothetical protein
VQSSGTAGERPAKSTTTGHFPATFMVFVFFMVKRPELEQVDLRQPLLFDPENLP